MSGSDKQQADDLRDRLESEVGSVDALADVQTRQQANAAVNATMDRVRGISEELTEQVHNSPLLTMAVAIGVGFVLGRVIR